MSADSRVARWTPVSWADGVSMNKADGGQYVLLSDHLSLLAEAEELAERNRNHWHTMKAERDSLQSRLDAVVKLVDEFNDCAKDAATDTDGQWAEEKVWLHCAEKLRSEALGCATTGEGGE